MRRRSVLVVAWAAALAAGCSPGDASLPPEPTVPTAPSSTTSTTVVDVSAIPEVIDEAYLNRVLAALDAVEARATELIVANKALVPEAAEILNSVYADDRFSAHADAWVEALVDDPALSSVRAGSRRTTVERVITAGPTCVWSEVRRDYSETTATPQPLQTEYVALRPLDPSNDPNQHNSTAWMITVDGFNADGSEPVDPCRG
ncbi:MAG: hypothetical protein ACRD03_08310 [Acidimicrobiales bacterium]